MIFPGLYEELDMERYAKLARDMSSQSNIMLALCDASGQIVWANEDNKNQLEAVLVEINEELYAEYAKDGCNYVARKHDNVSFAYCHLGELAGLPAGGLLFYDIDDVDGTGNSGRIVSKLSNIADIARAELYYLYEVNAMARELGNRYDELSMLRSSDLDLVEYRESRHILSTYIRSCTEHLKVDYGAIWVEARQSIYPAGIRYRSESTEILSLLEKLSIAASKMFRAGHNGFGINNNDEDLRRKIGLPADKKVLLVPVLDAAGRPRGVMSCLNELSSEDFTNSDKSTLEALSRKTYEYLQNTEDMLTGLLNKKGFEEAMSREMSRKQCERYLVLFDIDQFKVINAAYGIDVGDKLLLLLAKTINNPEFGLDFVTHIDADVFAAMLEVSEKEIEDRVKHICHEIDGMSFSVKGKALSIQSRAGVIALNLKETSIADHLYAAELALMNAKEDLSNQVVVYHPGNTTLLKRKHQLVQVENIKHALEDDRLVLYCQRIEPLFGGSDHYEILVRMINESGELVRPDEFIPVAERYNLMTLVDRWVLKNTFKLLSKEKISAIAADYKWGVNLSGMTVGDPEFHGFVSNCLHEYNFPPTSLYFEITETAAIKNFQNCASFMNKIHSLGVQFALDDFGSGLSSFGYLKKLSIDYLKIDGSLIRDIVSSRLDQAMVLAISDIARVLNVKTIAEYVEDKQIMEILREFNIDYAQGYGIMKPQAVELELKQLLEYVKPVRCSNQ